MSYLNSSLISLVTRDINGEEHVITDYNSLIYSNHYSEEGSGYGFLTFNIGRRSGFNYSDIGYGFTVLLRKGIKLLFKGIITRIDESINDSFEIGAVGLGALLTFDILNIVLADNRVNRWTAGCTARGSFRPDKFDHSLNWTEIINEGQPNEEEIAYDGLDIQPKRGVEYNEDDYYYLRYRFQFNETAKRLTATYKLALPNNWPGKASILDADSNIIWSSTISGNGTLDLDLDATFSGNFVEVRFEVTIDGINTAEEETVYFRLWDLTVYSTDETMDAAVVARVVAEYMHDNFGFSDDYSLIDTIGYEIPQAAYDDDRPLTGIMIDACQYGDPNLNPLAWGVAMDDEDRMFLEVQNIGTLYYKITEANDYTITGDLTDSFQKVYGKYTDTFGQEHRTSVISADEQIESLGGLYKKSVLDLQEVTTGQANQALNLALSENKEPKITTDFEVAGFIYTMTDGVVPIEEIVSGKIVQVPDLRAREATVLDDKRQGAHTFMLRAVEINLSERKAKLIPAGARSTFSTYMEKIKRLKDQQ